MCVNLRGRRIEWHALNARFEFFNLPPTRINLHLRKEIAILIGVYNFILD